MPHHVDGVLLHAMSGTELSRVRTELERLRILTTIPPHPVQTDSQPAPRPCASSCARNPSLAGTAPNELWCTDYKGEFLLGNHQYCYPLTVTDHASRFLLTRIEVLSCAILVSYK